MQLLEKFKKIRYMGGGVLRYKWLMGCAAEWGRLFTTGLTIMGLHFQQSYQKGVARFRDFWDKKILVSRDLKIGRFAVKNGLCCFLIINSRLALNFVHEITTFKTLTTCTIVQNPWVQNKVQQIIPDTVFIFRLFCVVIVH